MNKKTTIRLRCDDGVAKIIITVFLLVLMTVWAFGELNEYESVEVFANAGREYGGNVTLDELVSSFGYGE